MPSHFSSLGFPVEDQEEFVALALRTAEAGERAGDYVVWRPSPGIELWAQVEGDELIGLNPHFAGAARMDVAITERVRPEGQPPLDGTLYAMVGADDPSDPASGFPIVFDVPDIAALALPALPVAARAQLALFAHELAWFADEAAFYAAQEEPHFAAESFLPTGTFSDPPAPDALAHGHLVEGGRRTNDETGLPYWAGRVATLGGEIDVVADDQLVEGEPAPGAVLRVGGWLSARVHDVRASAG